MQGRGWKQDFILVFGAEGKKGIKSGQEDGSLKPRSPITDWYQTDTRTLSVKVRLYLFSILIVIHGWLNQQARYLFGMGKRPDLYIIDG